MSRRGKETTPEKRITIQSLYEKGEPIKKISEIVKRKCATVYKIIKRYKKSSDFKSKPRSGRPCKMTARDKRKIILIIKKDPKTPSSKIASEIKESSGTEFHPRTIRSPHIAADALKSDLAESIMACICEMIGVACFVAVLLSLSSKAPYQLKMAIYLIGCGSIVLISLPFMILRPKDYRNALIPAKACVYLCRALGVAMEVRGVENVRVQHGSVIIMNHQSALDLLVLAYLWPVIGRATVVSKKEIFYFPFFGLGAWLWGTLFINRSKKSDSINSLIKESKAIKERNCKLLLFPEGTRNSDETLLPFKKGSFHIALQSQCPIQPVVISKYWFLNTEKKIFRPGRAIIHILPEISTEGMTTDNINELTEKCRAIMQTEYYKLSQEAKYHNSKKEN